MGLLKKYYSIKANSILESVIALSIISVCLYIAILIVAAVLVPKATAGYYATQNKINEIFFLAEIQNDSILNNSNTGFMIEEETETIGLKKITVLYKDSLNYKFHNTFYVQEARK